jgi:hypothetical protein
LRNAHGETACIVTDRRERNGRRAVAPGAVGRDDHGPHLDLQRGRGGIGHREWGRSHGNHHRGRWGRFWHDWRWPWRGLAGERGAPPEPGGPPACGVCAVKQRCQDGHWPVSRVLSGSLAGLLERDRSRPPAAYPRRLCRVGRSRRLLGLAPAGVCRANPVARVAVGSYPTVSPLPARLATHGRSVFCGTFHRATRVTRPGVTWRPAQWSPDFPRGCVTRATVQPMPA